MTGPKRRCIIRISNKRKADSNNPVRILYQLTRQTFVIFTRSVFLFYFLKEENIMEWISVDDRLPNREGLAEDESEYVLVCQK